MSIKANQFYEFGPFRLDSVNRLLLRDGQLLPLKPKVMDTLLLLVKNNGNVLGKVELIDKLWPETIVEESNLTQNIYVLRKILDDGSNESRYIENIPRRGYRFIAPVSEVSGAEISSAPSHLLGPDDFVQLETDQNNEQEIPIIVSTPPPAKKKRRLAQRLLYISIPATILAAALIYVWMADKDKGSGPAASIRSIAVLPFDSLGSDANEEPVGLGMADALITKLSSIKKVKVSPTSAVLKYSNRESDPIAFGRQLGVDSVIEGRLQRSNDLIRVTVQLLRVADGDVLWSEQFNENFTNVFAVQDSISEQVVQALTLRLTNEEVGQIRKHYTDNATAYQAYLKGRFFWNKRTVEGFTKSIEYFQQSIDIDPNYALAYAGLADCYMRLNDHGVTPREGTIPQAKAAVLKALEIDDSLAEAHATLGFINFRFEWDFASSEREFKRAIELNPNYAIAHQWYAFYLLTTDRPQEALTELNRARELDPLSLNIGSGFGTYFYFTRQHGKAIEQLRNTLEMDQGFAEARWILGLAYEQQGLSEQALDELKTLRDSSGNRNAGIVASVGHVYAITGRKAEALELLRELQELAKHRYVSPYEFAVVHAGLGDKEQAVTMLEKAYTERSLRPAWLKFDPRLDDLRSIPRFQNLLN